MQGYLKASLLVGALSISLLGCNNQATDTAKNTDNTKITENEKNALSYQNIIPLPVELSQRDGFFDLTKLSAIYIDNQNSELHQVAAQLKSILNTEHNITVSTLLVGAASASGNIIVLSTNSELSGGREAYQLDIQKQRIVLTGATVQGVFRGIQTLKSLLPDGANGQTTLLKQGLIKDYPRYEHRGFMLDVARHFYTVDEVKQVIDYLATYKFNVFHFHLTDDQGWRINIPSWPKLTTVGSNSAVGQKSCENCFYTLDEYEEIVKYADERFITLIPEIDVPGHVRAAQASYPEQLYCDGNKPDWPYTGIEVRISSLCFKNPEIYKFFDDVVAEVAKRTTGKYIHVGGDETPKWVKHEDYEDFMLNALEIIRKHDKEMIGWTDDLGSVKGLDASVMGQHWTTEKHCCKNTLAMANKGSKIVMSPANKAYFDLKYDKDAPIGLNWAGYNSIENSYSWDPEKMIEGLAGENIIGVEGALWGETITSMQDAQYMMFPRLISLSEVAWSPQQQRNWQVFKPRLQKQIDQLKQKGIHFRTLEGITK